MMSNSCKTLINEHKKYIVWLRKNNEDGSQNKNIIFRENEIERLKNNPF